MTTKSVKPSKPTKSTKPASSKKRPLSDWQKFVQRTMPKLNKEDEKANKKPDYTGNMKKCSVMWNAEKALLEKKGSKK